jgi:hypothetical protein
MDARKELRLRPFRKPSTVAGNVICVMNGDYTLDNVEQIVLYTRNGAPARWTVLRADPGHKPELRTTGWNGIRINGAGVSTCSASGDWPFRATGHSM